MVDLGYDLPLPYGVGLTYANVNQDMFLGALQVGINGGAKEPFDWISFENPSADSESVQLKLDAWLFPFMNVFRLFGKVKGKAPLDVLNSGNGMLDQLGIDCSTPPPNPQCAVLQDKRFTLSIQAPFAGNTYGIGTVLAGGWNNWFVTIPFSVTYADMDTTNTDGLVITVTPRFGRVINLGGAGNLALFAGGNYLSAELTVAGTCPTLETILLSTTQSSRKTRMNGTCCSAETGISTSAGHGPRSTTDLSVRARLLSVQLPAILASLTWNCAAPLPVATGMRVFGKHRARGCSRAEPPVSTYVCY